MKNSKFTIQWFTLGELVPPDGMVCLCHMESGVYAVGMYLETHSIFIDYMTGQDLHPDCWCFLPLEPSCTASVRKKQKELRKEYIEKNFKEEKIGYKWVSL